MRDDKVLTRNKEEKPFYRPTYYMKPKEKESGNSKLEKVSVIKTGKTSFPETKEYKLNLDKIKTLEDVKEVLGALNIRVTITGGIVSHNGYDVNKLMKYIDVEENDAEIGSNKIELQFEDEVNRLVGVEFGRDVYKRQIEKKINYSKKNIIIVPNAIEDISISFIQGLTEKIFENISKDEFEKYFKISGNQNIVDKIIKSVYL